MLQIALHPFVPGCGTVITVGDRRAATHSQLEWLQTLREQPQEKLSRHSRVCGSKWAAGCTERFLKTTLLHTVPTASFWVCREANEGRETAGTRYLSAPQLQLCSLTEPILLFALWTHHTLLISKLQSWEVRGQPPFPHLKVCIFCTYTNWLCSLFGFVKCPAQERIKSNWSSETSTLQGTNKFPFKDIRAPWWSCVPVPFRGVGPWP